MILPAVRDPRLVLIRRGGLMADADHQLLALWAAACAEHVLGLFEELNRDDGRPRAAIDAARAWTRGEAKMMLARAIGGHAMGAARPLRGAPRFAAYAAGQAACVAHVPEHDLGAAAYAIKAAAAAAPRDQEREAARAERDWQRQQIPDHLRPLVLEDQGRRSGICWSVFDD
ncbi:putative immunity protein [Arthrobacter sp. TMN-37]